MSLVAPAATSAAVRRGLTSSQRDTRGTIFYLLLLLSLLFSLAVLAALLLDVMSRAIPVFQTRGLDFLTSPLSSDPTKAGIAQGLFGTIVIALLIPVISFPFAVKPLTPVAVSQLVCTAFAAMAAQNTYLVDGTVTISGTDGELPSQTCQAF